MSGKSAVPALRMFSPQSQLDRLLFNMSYFDQMVDVEEHTHSCIEIALVVKGTAEHISGDTRLPMHRGMVCITMPGGSHGMIHCEHLLHYNIACSTELLHEIGVNLEFLRGIKKIFGQDGKTVLIQLSSSEISDAERIVSRMYEMYEQKYKLQNGDMRFQFALFLCLLAQAYSRCGELGESRFARIVSVAAYLQEHYYEEMSLDKLARLASVSKAHLIRIFHQEYGQSPIDYLLEIRLNEAREFLQYSKLTVKEIAFRCGFSNVNYFLHFFKNRMGCTPGAYRMKKQKG